MHGHDRDYLCLVNVDAGRRLIEAVDRLRIEEDMSQRKQTWSQNNGQRDP